MWDSWNPLKTNMHFRVQQKHLPGDTSSLLTFEASAAAPGVVSTGILGSPRYCGVDGDQPPAADMTDDVTIECVTGVRKGDEDTMESGDCS